MNIGDRMKIYRKSADLSREKMGDILGVSTQKVEQYENGEIVPDEQDSAQMLAAVEGNQSLSVKEKIAVISAIFLNTEGLRLVAQRVNELAAMPEYRKNSDEV